MYNNEWLFIDKFLSTLKKLNISSIPFRNEQYRLGVYEMQKRFLSIESDIDPKIKDIKLLFLDGGEGDLVDAIME